MTDAERLQHHLNMLRGQPLVRLTGKAADEQAYRLRMRGLTYSGVALVMGIYHGEWYSYSHWWHRCRALGAPSRRVPRGAKP